MSELILCEICKKNIKSDYFKRHIESCHKIKLLNYMQKYDYKVPKCSYCNNFVKFKFTEFGLKYFKTCGSKSCLKKKNSDIQRLAAKKRVENGTCNLMHKNLILNNKGESLMHKKIYSTRSEDGPVFDKSVIEKRGKSISKAQKILVEKGSHHLLSENRPKDENGRDIYMMKANATKLRLGTHHFQNRKYKYLNKHIIHRENMNYKFLKENFINENNIFKIEDCQKYFNCSYSFANKLKLKYFGHILQHEPKQISKLELQLRDYINSLGDFKIEFNNRSLIDGYELDIYLPDYNLAIEFDGIYWHSDKYVDSNYHVRKTIKCEKKGVKLLHIFENEWLDEIKCDIWKSVIKQHLGFSNVIYARNCEVRKISSNIQKFEKENHLQGYIPSSINYGLFYNNELVSLMTFGKSRFDKSYDFELLRFCNKKGIRIVGGASRLLKYFKNDYKGSLISYANRRWSNGKLYESLGFKKDRILGPEYFYTKDFYNLLKRYSCQKHKLPKLLGDKFDSKLTERENMKNAGYSIIYDCGNLRYILED